jgi:hypothetical protein
MHDLHKRQALTVLMNPNHQYAVGSQWHQPVDKESGEPKEAKRGIVTPKVSHDMPESPQHTQNQTAGQGTVTHL